MNKLKPEDVMPEGAVVEALEIRAPHDAVCRYALALLREKDAEIDRLNKEVDRLSQVVLYHDAFVNDAIADARSEAISEFVNRLKERMREVYPADIYDSDIDQIANEPKGVNR